MAMSRYDFMRYRRNPWEYQDREADLAGLPGVGLGTRPVGGQVSTGVELPSAGDVGSSTRSAAPARGPKYPLSDMVTKAYWQNKMGYNPNMSPSGRPWSAGGDIPDMRGFFSRTRGVDTGAGYDGRNFDPNDGIDRSTRVGYSVPGMRAGGEIDGPSGTDMVPAQMPGGAPARLDDGEFVLPKRYVIEKARKELGKSGQNLSDESLHRLGIDLLEAETLELTGEMPGAKPMSPLPGQGPAPGPVLGMAEGGEVDDLTLGQRVHQGARLPGALRGYAADRFAREVADPTWRFLSEATTGRRVPRAEDVEQVATGTYSMAPADIAATRAAQAAQAADAERRAHNQQMFDRAAIEAAAASAPTVRPSAAPTTTVQAPGGQPAFVRPQGQGGFYNDLEQLHNYFRKLGVGTNDYLKYLALMTGYVRPKPAPLMNPYQAGMLQNDRTRLGIAQQTADLARAKHDWNKQFQQMELNQPVRQELVTVGMPDGSERVYDPNTRQFHDPTADAAATSFGSLGSIADPDA